VRTVFTPSAERQLDSLHRYIAERAGEGVADGYIGRIVTFCRSLTPFPLRGAARDDLLPGLRTIGFERRATIAFMVTPELVVIEGVFYGGQDYEAHYRA
jgi:toxin ParE1/3/4